MNVTDFETGALAIQTAGPECRKSALVRDLRKRVDLVHELRKLRTREEIANDGRQRFRVDQLLRGDRVDALVIHCHALADEALGAAEADAALVGEKLANGADATGTEVIDVVDYADATFQTNEIFRRSDNITGLQTALLELDLEAELLVDLVTTNATKIVTFWVKEETLEKGFRVRRGGRLAGTEALVDFLQRFLLVASRILLERADDRARCPGNLGRTS